MAKPTPSPFLRPIPPFANVGTLCADFAIFTSPPLFLLAFFDRSLTIVSSSFWTFGIVPTSINANVVGRDHQVVPNGAEFFGLLANNLLPVQIEVYDRISIRWRLHV